MKLKNVIQTKLAKTLVAALLIGSVSNTGFTVQAEEATQNEQNDVVEMASVSGNDSSVAVEGKSYPTIKTVILAGGTMAKYVGGQVASPNVWPNNYKPANGDFSLFAGHKMTLDDAETFKYLSVDNTGVDAEGNLRIGSENLGNNRRRYGQEGLIVQKWPLRSTLTPLRHLSATSSTSATRTSRGKRFDSVNPMEWKDLGRTTFGISV